MTMTPLTTGKKTLLRADGHKTSLYLTVFAPTALLTASVSGSPDFGATAISYTATGQSSTLFAKITSNMPVMVYTAAGLLERVRLKNIAGDESSGIIALARNSVDWSLVTSIVILYDRPLFPVFPWIDEDGNFFKDDAVPYVNQNEKAPPVAIAGFHRANFTGVFSVDAGESYAVAYGANISVYSWSCDGGTFTSTGTSASTSETDTVTVTSEGQAWLKLIVTDSNGTTQTAYRQLYYHSTDPDDSDYPFSDFTVGSLTLDYQRGGASVSVECRGAVDATQFPDNALIVIWEDAIFGTTAGSVGHTENVIFCGYLRGDTTQADWNDGSVSFEATTIEAILQRFEMTSVTLTEVDNPGKWYEYAKPLTNARALHHYWRFHSTLFSICDVFLPMDNTYRRKYADFQQGTLWNVGQDTIGQHGILAKPVCNKVGQIFIEIDLQILNDEDRAAVDVISDITLTDRREQIELLRRPYSERPTSLLHLSGIAIDSGDNANPLISRAPGENPASSGGGTVNYERLTLYDQTQANELAGRLFAQGNNEFLEARVRFAGHYWGVIDVVPQRWWTADIAAGETPRAIVWDDKKLIPRNITFSYNPETGVALCDVVFEPETFGVDGIPGEFPTPSTLPSPDTSLPDPDPAPSNFITLTPDNEINLLYDNTVSWDERTANADMLSMEVDKSPTVISGPENTILYVGQSDGIMKSTDAGDNWAILTIPDPLNVNAIDSPTPGDEDVAYMYLKSLGVFKSISALGSYQNGDTEERGQLYHTSDGGTTIDQFELTPPYDWWIGSGMTDADLIAVYEAKGAETFNASLVNIIDPGTDDLIGSALTDPAWNINDGWKFSEGKYLQTSIEGSTDISIVAIVTIESFEGGIDDAFRIASVRETGTSYYQLFMFDNRSGEASEDRGFRIYKREPAGVGGTLHDYSYPLASISAKTPYVLASFRTSTKESMAIDGTVVFEGSPNMAANLFGEDYYIGAYNDGTITTGVTQARIAAIAFYDIALTNAQVVEISNKAKEVF